MWRRWYQNPRAFWLETINTIVMMTASLWLLLTVDDVPLQGIVGLYLVSSVLAVGSSWLRHQVMVMVISVWFVVINSVTLVRLWTPFF